MVELRFVDGLSYETVRQVLKNALKPWLTERWRLPGEPSGEYVARMEDVLSVYQQNIESLPSTSDSIATNRSYGYADILLAGCPGSIRIGGR